MVSNLTGNKNAQSLRDDVVAFGKSLITPFQADRGSFYAPLAA